MVCLIGTYNKYPPFELIKQNGIIYERNVDERKILNIFVFIRNTKHTEIINVIFVLEHKVIKHKTKLKAIVKQIVSGHMVHYLYYDHVSSNSSNINDHDEKQFICTFKYHKEDSCQDKIMRIFFNKDFILIQNSSHIKSNIFNILVNFF